MWWLRFRVAYWYTVNRPLVASTDQCKISLETSVCSFLECGFGTNALPFNPYRCFEAECWAKLAGYCSFKTISEDLPLQRRAPWESDIRLWTDRQCQLSLDCQYKQTSRKLGSLLSPRPYHFHAPLSDNSLFHGLLSSYLLSLVPPPAPSHPGRSVHSLMCSAHGNSRLAVTDMKLIRG